MPTIVNTSYHHPYFVGLTPSASTRPGTGKDSENPPGHRLRSAPNSHADLPCRIARVSAPA